MPAYLCHEYPTLMEFDTHVVDARPGAVVLERSALHPGGGGQVADSAEILHAAGVTRVQGITLEEGRYWHHLDAPLILHGRVDVRIDRARRLSVSQLHTAAHMLNALVFQQFAGALVTGAQINGDGTGRLDFDLPEIDNDLLRALEPSLNALIRDARDVRTFYLSRAEVRATPGLVRTMDAYPETSEDAVRVVEISGLDRQVCGGTHVDNTGECRQIRFTKIENKGRRNRRIRFALTSQRLAEF
jgi:misacylated tRNA(Ala) deacylase